MEKDKYLVQVNDQWQFELDSNQTLDTSPAGNPNQVHALFQNKGFHVIIEEFSLASKEYQLRINGRPYRVKLQDGVDQLVQSMGMRKKSGRSVDQIKAPMPGLVLQVLTAPGQSVTQGQPLLILEAMKMENVIKSPGDSIIQSIAVQQGQAVDKGQLLIQMG